LAQEIPPLQNRRQNRRGKYAILRNRLTQPPSHSVLVETITILDFITFNDWLILTSFKNEGSGSTKLQAQIQGIYDSNGIAPVYPGLVTLFAFLMGTIWGSFLNVCIYRIPQGKSIVFPPSHCGACGTRIKWYDNIPVVSYFLLGGTCRACGAHFSVRYACIEALTGLLFAGVVARYGLSAAAIAHCVVICLLIIGTFTDIDHFIIPDSVTLGGLFFAVLSAAVLGRSSIIGREFEDACLLFQLRPLDLGNSMIARYGERGVILLFSIFSALFAWSMLQAIAIFGRIVFRKEAMGGGDIKLFAFLGAYFGAMNSVVILLLSSAIGALLGLLFLGWHMIFSGDHYDEFLIDLDRIRKPPSTKAVSLREGNNDQIYTSPHEEPRDSNYPNHISLLLAKKTARQLHHFPFGPYIALAALIVLFAHPEIEKWLYERFFFIPMLLEP